jgi:short-subunit dehydrogenase
MKNQNKKYALLTGASQGIGKAMAHELASKNINLLLVSLKGEGLADFCTEIQNKYNVDAKYFETDFYQYDSVYDVAKWAISNYSVNILINNAGIGGTKAFESATPEYIDNIIQVNVRTTSLLTRLMLPELKKQDKSYILNVASMASFSPFAFKTVYPASKAFIYSFSRGLHEELKGTNVFVSVIHPGPVKTNADVTARIEKQGFFGKIGQVSPQELARIAIKQLLKRDSLILPGILNKLNWVLMMLLPNAWKLPILSRVVRKEINSLNPVGLKLSTIKQ